MSRCAYIEVEEFEDAVVLCFTAALKTMDEDVADSVREPLFGWVEKLANRHLFLDFRNIEYLSSAAIGMFLSLNKKVHANGRGLKMCNIDPQIYEVFEITKLTKLFDIQRDFDPGDGVGSRLTPPDQSFGQQGA